MKRAFYFLAMASVISTPVNAAPRDARASVASPSPAEAAAVDPQSQVLARQLFEILADGAPDGPEYMRQLRQNYYDSITIRSAQPATARVDDKTRTTFERIFASIAPKIEYHLPRVWTAYAMAYARRYSADELRQVIAFASTPAGKHFLQSFAEVGGDPDVNEANEQMSQAIDPLMEELNKEVCQRRTAIRVAAGETNAKCPYA